MFSPARKISSHINSKPLSYALKVRITATVACVSVLGFFILTRDLLIFLEMKAAISVVFVLFCLLLPSEGASNADKNASTSSKVRPE